MSGDDVRVRSFKVIRMRLVKQLGVNEDDVTLEASFKDDLEADSLDLTEVIMSLEDDFGLKIGDEDAQKLTTVDEAIRFIVDENGRAPTETALKDLADYESESAG